MKYEIQTLVPSQISPPGTWETLENIDTKEETFIRLREMTIEAIGAGNGVTLSFIKSMVQGTPKIVVATLQIMKLKTSTTAQIQLFVVVEIKELDFDN